MTSLDDETTPLLPRHPVHDYRCYGRVVVDWAEGATPEGVRVFYIKEQLKSKTKLQRVLAIAYVRGKGTKAGTPIYFASSIFSEDKPNDWRRSFKKLIRARALERLHDAPRFVLVPHPSALLLKILDAVSKNSGNYLHHEIRQACYGRAEPLIEKEIAAKIF